MHYDIPECLKPITVIVKADMSIDSTKRVKIFLI